MFRLRIIHAVVIHSSSCHVSSWSTLIRFCELYMLAITVCIHITYHAICFCELYMLAITVCIHKTYHAICFCVFHSMLALVHLEERAQSLIADRGRGATETTLLPRLFSFDNSNRLQPVRNWQLFTPVSSAIVSQGSGHDSVVVSTARRPLRTPVTRWSIVEQMARR